MDLGDERAGGVDGAEPAAAAAARMAGATPWRCRARSRHRGSRRSIDEDDAPLPEALDDVPVVDDLVIDVERRAEELEARSRLSIAMLTPAQNPRVGQNDLHARLPSLSLSYRVAVGRVSAQQANGPRYDPWAWDVGNRFGPPGSFLPFELGDGDPLLAVLFARLPVTFPSVGVWQILLWYFLCPPCRSSRRRPCRLP